MRNGKLPFGIKLNQPDHHQELNQVKKWSKGAAKTDVKKDTKAAIDTFSKNVDFWTLIFLSLTFAIFNCYYWSSNLSRSVSLQYRESSKTPNISHG